tara:strand:+ start:8507 stop:9031 length:525 start_codon:yes stop_codon:yes gene_type:complete
MKHTQITSNVVRELFSKELTKCLVTVEVPYQYIREDNTIDVKKMGKISININGKFSLRQANKITIAMIGLANGELKSDVLVLPLEETPSPSFLVMEYKIPSYNSENMYEKYQAVIDDIPDTALSATHYAAYLFACAIKECMTADDSYFCGRGYIWEKVSKAMKELGMPIQEGKA